MPLPTPVKPIVYADEIRGKPHQVWIAELVLWVWTLWMFLAGSIQSIKGIPEIEDLLTTQLQGIVEISPDILTKAIIGSYALIALLSAWVIWSLGKGKGWARGTLISSVLVELLCEIWPQARTAKDYAMAIPDYLPQFYALYLLYMTPGRLWFKS